MAFNATEAAFEGFRLVRERPAAVLVWAGLFLVFGLLSVVALVGLAGPAFNELLTLSREGGQTDPAAAADLFGALAPAYAMLLVLSLVFYAVLYTAVTRAVLRPEQSGFGYVRLGADELRTGIVLLAIWLAVGVLYMLLGVVAALIAGLSIAATGGGGGAAAAIAFVAAGVVAVLLLYVIGRLSPAVAQSFDQRRVSPFGAWKLTRGKGWALVGALVIAAFMSLIVGLLGLVVFMALAAAFGGGLAAAGAVFQPDMSSLQTYLTPATVAYLVVSALLNALVNALLVGVGARAYKQLTPTA